MRTEKNSKEKTIKTIIVTLVAGLIISLGGNGYFAFTGTDGKDYEIEIHQKEKEIKQLNQKLVTSDSEKQELQGKAEKMERKLAEQEKENELLERQVSE